MNRFLFGPYVDADLRQIRDHVREDSAESARRLMSRFVEAFRLLARRPELGHVRADLLPTELRFWPVGSTSFIYRADKRPIEVVAVVHGARDVPSILNRRL